jgi:membrane-bound lytic murein transglycosylase B
MKQLFAILALLIFLPNTAHSKQAEGFSDFLDQIAAEAYKNGISKETISSTISSIEFLPKVIELDRAQPEFKKNFIQYKDRVVNNQRIIRARNELTRNRKALEEVEKHFGVEKEFIVALWAIESNFGENQGSYFIPSTLATLAYEGRRHDFFRKELIASMKILDGGHINKTHFKGSWAGAMGQCQFMPTSFLNYAADYDGDGKKDIWGNRNDVFASVANYLSQKGWNKGGQYARLVYVPTKFGVHNLGTDKLFTLRDLRRMGVSEVDGSNLVGGNYSKASILDLTVSDKGDKKYIMIFDNYKTVLKWNKSSYFATSVGIIAELLKQ